MSTVQLYLTFIFFYSPVFDAVSWKDANVWESKKSETEIDRLINGQNTTLSDFNITKLLWLSRGEQDYYSQIMPYFQPDKHVQNNEAFSIAMMTFISKRFGFELKKWKYTELINEKHQQYMGLGLQDSQILLYNNELLVKIGQVDNPQIFTAKKSICQRILHLGMQSKNLEAVVDKMPELLRCATHKEIEYICHNWHGNLIENKVRSQLQYLDNSQKDSFMKSLSFQPMLESDPALAQFLFYGEKRLPSKLQYTSAEAPYVPGITRLFAHAYSTVSIWKDSGKFSSNLLRSYTPTQVHENFGNWMGQMMQTRPKLREYIKEIQETLCDYLTLYQKHLIYEKAYTELKQKMEDKTPWSNGDKQNLGCLLNPAPREQNRAIETVTMPKDKTTWDQFITLDSLLEYLFFHGGEIRLRDDAIDVTGRIRKLFKATTGKEIGLTKLQPYQLNAVPAFILREFWTTEFDFTVGRLFEVCTETFIRIGTVDNRDLTTEKRGKLVEIFLSKCGGLFEDNMRVLNTLSCDYPAHLFNASQNEAMWLSRFKNCSIINPVMQENIWSSIKHQDLEEIAFILGPTNLCNVIPKETLKRINVTLVNIDRLVWTFDHMDAMDNSSCAAVFAAKIRDALKTAQTDQVKTRNAIEPCEDIRILKQLNKHLEDDWLSTHKDLQADDLKCINLIGSNSNWFTQNQLRSLAKASVNKYVMEINECEIATLWELDNIIPYLNHTALSHLLEGDLDAQKMIGFISQLNWPNHKNFSDNAGLVIERYISKSGVTSFGSENSIQKMRNINCAVSATVYGRMSLTKSERTELIQFYYCTKEGQIVKSVSTLTRVGKSGGHDLFMTPLLLQEHHPGHVSLANQPIEALDSNMDMLLNSTWEGMTTEQALNLRNNHHRKLSHGEKKILQLLLNAEEEIVLSTPEEKDYPEEDTPEEFDLDTFRDEEEIEYFYYNIIYIEASATTIRGLVSMITLTIIKLYI